MAGRDNDGDRSQRWTRELLSKIVRLLAPLLNIDGWGRFTRSFLFGNKILNARDVDINLDGMNIYFGRSDGKKRVEKVSPVESEINGIKHCTEFICRYSLD